MSRLIYKYDDNVFKQVGLFEVRLFGVVCLRLVIVTLHGLFSYHFFYNISYKYVAKSLYSY